MLEVDICATLVHATSLHLCYIGACYKLTFVPHWCMLEVIICATLMHDTFYTYATLVHARSPHLCYTGACHILHLCYNGACYMSTLVCKYTSQLSVNIITHRFNSNNGIFQISMNVKKAAIAVTLTGPCVSILREVTIVNAF